MSHFFIEKFLSLIFKSTYSKEDNNKYTTYTEFFFLIHALGPSFMIYCSWFPILDGIWETDFCTSKEGVRQTFISLASVSDIFRNL